MCDVNALQPHALRDSDGSRLLITTYLTRPIPALLTRGFSCPSGCAEGELDPESISEDMLYAHMDSGRKGLPPPDLLIRTSGK